MLKLVFDIFVLDIRHSISFEIMFVDFANDMKIELEC